jgi:hypothetical protein
MSPRQQAIETLIARLREGKTLKSKDKIEQWSIGDLIIEVKKRGIPLKIIHKRPAVMPSKWWEGQANRYAEYTLRGDK